MHPAQDTALLFASAFPGDDPVRYLRDVMRDKIRIMHVLRTSITWIIGRETAPYQDRMHPRALGKFHIAPLVPHHIGMADVNAEILHRTVDQTRLRLAAIAVHRVMRIARMGVMGTEIKTIYARTFHFQHFS